MLPLFAFGLLLGTQRRALLWAAAAVPVVVQIDWFSVAYPSSSPVVQTVLSTLPFVGVTALGVAPGPLARVLDRLRTTPLSALVLLNVLNVADAVLTWMAVDAKQASTDLAGQRCMHAETGNPGRLGPANRGRLSRLG